MSSLGCITDSCLSGVQFSMGFCKTHCLEYWALGGKSPGSKGKWFEGDGGRSRCGVRNCVLPVLVGGLCSAHYQSRSYRKNRRTSAGVEAIPRIDAEGAPLQCTVEGCDQVRKARGMCEKHYTMNRKHGVTDHSPYATCPTPDCGRTKVHSAKMCKRCNQLRWRYSLSVSDVNTMFLESNYRCCNPGCEQTKNLHVDHDHKCCPNGKFGTSHKRSCGECVRGWLCKNCNNALGMLQENPRKIRGLLAYLGIED